MSPTEKTTDSTIASTGSDLKPTVKDGSAEPKLAFDPKIKKVKIERLDIKGNGLSYRGFTVIKGTVCTVKVKGDGAQFVPGIEVQSSEIIELAEANAAQLKRYQNAGQKKVKIDFELLAAA